VDDSAGIVPNSPGPINSQRRVRTKPNSGRSSAMDTPELRAKAAHYKRVAQLVSDAAAAEALLELAAEYESLADRLSEKEPTRGAAKT
jgi:hypothetical protein